MPYRRSNSRRKTSSTRFAGGSKHQTAVQITTTNVPFSQTNSIVVPAMVVGEESRNCSGIKFQIAADTSGESPFTYGYAVQYVPAGMTPQVIDFDQTTSGTLCAANQFILAAGVFMSDNAPNTFYARGHRLDDGDEIVLSIVVLTTQAAIMYAIFNYTIYTK